MKTIISASFLKTGCILVNEKMIFFSLSQTLVDIIRSLPDTNIASLLFALISAVVLIVVKELSARYRHKLRFPIPIEIITVGDSQFANFLNTQNALLNVFYCTFVTNIEYRVDNGDCCTQVVVATAISGPLNLPEIYHMDIVGEISLGYIIINQWLRHQLKSLKGIVCYCQFKCISGLYFPDFQHQSCPQSVSGKTC